MADISIRKATK